MTGTMRAIAVALALCAVPLWSPARADSDQASFDPSIRRELAEPVTLTSKDGVLEVRLIVKQDQARLDTVAIPVKNFMLFAYELIRGTASNGKASGDGLYPGPTLQVMPGDTLIVHLDNALTGPQQQVIGVGQHHLRAGGSHLIDGQALDRGACADRHKGRRLHRAMRCGERPQSRRGGGVGTM